MYKFKITDIITQPNNNISIRFEDMSGNYPSYKAGQFLTLSFTFGEREVRRSYSFSSSPALDEALEITVKRVENGEISRLLHGQAKVGDIIDVMEPQGIFTYEAKPEQRNTVVLFAAGVGITPLYSILKTVLREEPDSKVVLVYSNSSKEQTVFYEELLQWQSAYPDRLQIEFIWSNAKNLLKARLNRDYLIELVKEHVDLSLENSIFYTCGPLFYMDLCRYTLLGMGIPDERIKRETFYFPEEESDDDETEEEIVDTTAYTVYIDMYGVKQELIVPHNQSILETGLQQKLKLPYSCKSGMCSTCISQVTSGSVRMDYNEVLTDREVESGRCLICTAHPLEEGTTIQIL